ncbi:MULTISPECIES: F0F1 ATP synthase subunit A [Sphingomonadales]|uniref:ATP synthase subunit a n=2 Tax=Edaphosphingomonas TaxID=3423724 RepID=A0A2T4I7P4_9SPHN|nr:MULTISPECIES: F0F1 ATP synthase subunit A [Sphingomonas]AGH48945.1 F0F1 ATP synthase subunit A [Sphingomonas sp. MM-1]MDX3884517.1 F0F1 ATP synthase subunit A [Sphingomonas sp.]OHT21361.1 ATP synthase subunit a [Sphingomonas haloaromaticamans]PTD27335.1 F0F1 ATP synthase subunit A [Sphingomonas fennica]
MAAEGGKIDPMHQFLIEPLFGRTWEIAGYNIAFTNSALFMVVTLACIWLFMLGGMKRELVPGRWQAAVEGCTGFIANMMHANIGPKGKAFTPYVFSLFMFILVANLVGMLPLGIVPGLHAFTVTSHLTVTGVLAIITFAIVLIVGFGKHGLHFFSLFVPQGTPMLMVPLLFVIELFSFLVRPFSLGLRLFVAMTAGHILLKVLAGFVISGANAGIGTALIVSIPSFVLMIGITLLELLVCAIQAYVFALLASLYLNDAINLH